MVSSSHKIMDFPQSQEHRLQTAIALFDSCNTLSADLLREFIALINEGCDEAYYFAGCIYEEGGNGIERDLEKARFYYQKSVDEYGYVEGYLALGRFYYYGIAVAQDFAKSFEYYSSIADKKDNPIVHLMLGKMYCCGQGVKKNLLTAREHLSRAIAKGNVYAIRQLASLEAEHGNYLKSLWLRLRAGLTAFNIGRKNMRDARLRRG